MHLRRSIEPEWLDELPPADPRAMRSRRDLRRINALMMNGRLVARELRRVFPGPAPRAIVEIGAGDGSFLLRVAEKLAPQWPAMDVVLLDQQSLVSPATSGRFTAIGWQAQAVSADVFAWLAQPAAPVFDVIVANLFLHHFDAARLAELLSLIARRTRVLIACEPQRSSRALFGSRMLGAIGCNDVTRHDAVVSVRAGFVNRELCGLWPAVGAWTLREYPYGLFSHCFVAARAENDASGACDVGAGHPA
ncbi:MAG: methyltransferase domain-containing protein [Betaproteobacteria bacterium]|nr:methyltransferase domain-containing protein [Betaproteobacteria bacterium]